MKKVEAARLVEILGSYKYASGLCHIGDDWYVSVADPTISTCGNVVKTVFETRFIRSNAEVWRFISERS